MSDDDRLACSRLLDQRRRVLDEPVAAVPPTALGPVTGDAVLFALFVLQPRTLRSPVKRRRHLADIVAKRRRSPGERRQPGGDGGALEVR